MHEYRFKKQNKIKKQNGQGKHHNLHRYQKALSEYGDYINATDKENLLREGATEIVFRKISRLSRSKLIGLTIPVNIYKAVMDKGKDKFYNNYKEIRKYLLRKNRFCTRRRRNYWIKRSVYNYKTH